MFEELESQELKSSSVIEELNMVVGSPDLVVARCQDLSQELINRDLHLVVGDVVLSYHQVRILDYTQQSLSTPTAVWIGFLKKNRMPILSF